MRKSKMKQSPIVSNVIRERREIGFVPILSLSLCMSQCILGNSPSNNVDNRNGMLTQRPEIQTEEVNDKTQTDGENNVHKEDTIADKLIEHYQNAAEQGDVGAQETLGWLYYGKDGTIESKAEAIRWWCKVGCRGSEMMKSLLRLGYHGKEKELIDNAADTIIAFGGRPLPNSREPLAFRVERGRRAYINKWLGFPEQYKSSFPVLASVTNATTFDLDFAKRFDEVVRGKLAQFPDDEIRWSENGTNGLSFADTAAKMNAAQIEIVQELMRGREEKRGKKSDDKSSASWILNDDFAFGYFTIPHKDGRDEVYYVFTTRHEMNGTAAKTSILVPFAPSQLISDSIMRSFLNDKAAQSNLNALKDAGIVIVID